MSVFSFIINIFRIVIGGPLVIYMVIITVVFFTLFCGPDEGVDMAGEIWEDYINGF